MFIQELWRYPVKSMGGERLESARLLADGIEGDRRALVVRADRIITSRTHPRLLALAGTVDDHGEPLVDGWRWNSAVVVQRIEQIAGQGARLVRWEGPERFDVLPLLITTDGAVAAMNVDRRRFRPNIMIRGVHQLDERDWEGQQLRIGEAVVQMHDLRGRCVMTTYDPDTQTQDLSVLRKIVRDFDGTFGLNASVVREGLISAGDPVQRLQPPDRVGG